jgi:hypothetical protein
MQHTAHHGHLAPTTIAAIATVVTIIILFFFVLLIVIIILLVVGIIPRARRKNDGHGSIPKSDNTSPNPVYHDNQGSLNQYLQYSALVIGVVFQDKSLVATYGLTVILYPASKAYYYSQSAQLT